MSKTQILETILDKKIRFLLHQTSQFYYILSPFCQTTADFAKTSYTWAPPSPPLRSMLELCPSAYGLTAVTEFGRDNIVVGGRRREGEKEQKLKNFIKISLLYWKLTLDFLLPNCLWERQMYLLWTGIHY